MKQYFDPRIVLFHICVASLTIFFVNSIVGLALEVALLSVFLFVLGLKRQGVTLLVFFTVVQGAFMLLAATGLSESVRPLVVLLILFRKLCPAYGIIMIFIHALSVSRFIAALEYLHMPKAITLSLAVALRFIPTIKEELSSIRDALAIRGRALSVGNVVRYPAETTECVMIPLMMRGVKIADELSASAVTRGLDNPERRTSYYEFRLSSGDIVYLAAVVISYGALLLYEIVLKGLFV